jgi:hypothetical protein
MDKVEREILAQNLAERAYDLECANERMRESFSGFIAAFEELAFCAALLGIGETERTVAGELAAADLAFIADTSKPKA